MGTEQQKKLKDLARRGWNAAGDQLKLPTLFSVPPTFGGRSFPARIVGSKVFSVGERLVLQCLENQRVVTRGPEIVAQCAPPAEITDYLDDGPLCVEVIQINPASNTLEIAADEIPERSGAEAPERD